MFELFTDIVFFIDILITFLTPYQRIDGSYEENHKKIARKYIKTDLLIDILAMFPTVLFE